VFLIFPHNCIGNIKTVLESEDDPPIFGTGFLISPTLVLTAAHNFQKVFFGEVFEAVPDSFLLEGRMIKIKNFRINRNLVDSLNIMTILENEKIKVYRKRIK
jgi:hypothetical protein